MSDVEISGNLHRPSRPSPATKAEITNKAARAIIKAEADRRDTKTMKLRQKRLEMEAQQPAPEPAKKRAVKNAKPSASAARARSAK